MYGYSSHLLKQFLEAIIPYASHNVIDFMVTTSGGRVKIRILSRFKETFSLLLRRFAPEQKKFSSKIRRIKEKVVTIKIQSLFFQ